jgi:hypothetical protein
MARYGDVAIFRRFGALNIFNLMSLQAELADLEDELKGLLKFNDRRMPVLLQDFYEIRTNDEGKSQLDLIEKIRLKLKEYSMHYSCFFNVMVELLTICQTQRSWRSPKLLR